MKLEVESDEAVGTGQYWMQCGLEKMVEVTQLKDISGLVLQSLTGRADKSDGDSWLPGLPRGGEVAIS